MSLMSGCHKSTVSLETKPAIKRWWGNRGVVPDKVWQDYEWVILSRDEYERTVK